MKSKKKKEKKNKNKNRFFLYLWICSRMCISNSTNQSLINVMFLMWNEVSFHLYSRVISSFCCDLQRLIHLLWSWCSECKWMKRGRIKSDCWMKRERKVNAWMHGVKGECELSRVESTSERTRSTLWAHGERTKN